MILVFTLLLYDKVSFICKFSTNYNIIWCQLNDNSICDVLRMSWRKTKRVMHDMPSLNFSSIFSWKVEIISKLPSHLFKKEDRYLGYLPNNFAEVTKKLSNLYCKLWPQQLSSSYRNIASIGQSACIGNILY